MRRARPAGERLQRSVYNALRCGRGGELATVVYSDRYFRYGLAIRAWPAQARRLVADELNDGAALERCAPLPRRGHCMPLHDARVVAAPGAGLLLGASPRIHDLALRYSPATAVVPRGRRRGPRALSLIAEIPFEPPAPPDPPAAGRRPALDYRQSAGGVEPRRPAATRARARRPLSRTPSSLRMSASPSPSPPLPQFALREGGEGADSAAEGFSSGDEDSSVEWSYERVYGALAKESPRVSAANLARADEVDKGAKWTQRKVLNTERFNNGARAPLVGAGAGERRQRATVRAMLAGSGLFYALAFVAFYLLSLP